MTGDAEHTRAAALALAISTLGFAILKFTDLKDRSEWVFAAAGAGALLGGLFFGLGMTLAGGCGAGSIWRAGEGQVKLWVAIATFALGASLVAARRSPSSASPGLGRGRLPARRAGLGRALLLVLGVMAAWALAATWNEQTGSSPRSAETGDRGGAPWGR